MNQKVIELNNVSREFGKHELMVTALQDISLSIDAGDFVSIVGPSGCGKSTTLHLMGGLDHPTRGIVRIQGQDLASLNTNELTDLRLFKLGFVFQAFNLIPVLSAAENIQFTLHLQGIDKSERRDRTHNTLKLLDLSKIAHRRPGELSGGQQQRVAIGRALVGNPQVLLADEPSANLDSNATSELCEQLAKVNQETGVTIVTATHDPLVMSFTRRRVQLQDGRILSEGRN